MNKGTVIYLVDAHKVDRDFDERQAIESLGLPQRWTVFAAGGEGFLDMQEASWILAARGAGSVDALWASPYSQGRVRPFGAAQRMFG